MLGKRCGTCKLYDKKEKKCKITKKFVMKITDACNQHKDKQEE